MASARKKWGIALAAGLFAALLLGLLALSSTSLRWAQERVDRNPEAPSARWLQLAVADICFRTWRPEPAAEGYRKFYERYAGDPRKPAALLRYAQSLERAGRNANAVDLYRKYLVEYPDLEGKEEAKQGINRIHLVRAD